jgi:hypothetical protein
MREEGTIAKPWSLTIERYGFGSFHSVLAAGLLGSS